MITDKNAPTKLIGQKQAEELIILYRQAGFSDIAISQELLEIESIVVQEVIDETQASLSEDEKKGFDEFLNLNPDPNEIANFLNLKNRNLPGLIETKIQNIIEKLQKEIKNTPAN